MNINNIIKCWLLRGYISFLSIKTDNLKKLQKYCFTMVYTI